MDFTVSEHDAPDENDRFNSEYALGLFNAIGEFKPDLILCLRYFSSVSVICSSAKVKYAAWICKSYEPDIYSCTLLNECNYIFFADKSLADEFGGGDFKHIYYLPLGVNKERIMSVLESEGESLEYDSDLTMMQDIRRRRELDNNPLSKNSPLKDATKGYIEGCLACQHQLSGLPSMAQNLPNYVREDLNAYFPPQVSGDSIEKEAHYYDYNYFNPLITYSQRDIHFHNLSVCNEFQRVNLYNGCDDYTLDGVTIHERADYLTRVPLIARKSKINLVITNRNWKSAIPQISWDIMASGGFLISNIQGDFFELFRDTLPVMYENEIDLKDKGKKYMHKEMEREKLAKELSQEVRERHTYENRINEMMEKI
jgi:spore maturation protein CgeB